MADNGLQDKGFVSFNFTNKKKFQAAIEKAAKQVADLRFPMGEIARDFYKSEKAIFQLKSAGAFPDFKSEKSRLQKKKEVGFEYPLLKRSGRLEASITSPNADGSILIIGKKDVIIGTSIKYGIFHNSDQPRSVIPQRKFVFIGPESKEFGKSKNIGGRLTRWVNILEDYVQAVLEAQKP